MAVCFVSGERFSTPVFIYLLSLSNLVEFGLLKKDRPLRSVLYIFLINVGQLHCPLTGLATTYYSKIRSIISGPRYINNLWDRYSTEVS